MSETTDNLGEVSYFYDKDGYLVLEGLSEPGAWVRSDTTCEDLL